MRKIMVTFGFSSLAFVLLTSLRGVVLLDLFASNFLIFRHSKEHISSQFSNIITEELEKDTEVNISFHCEVILPKEIIRWVQAFFKCESYPLATLTASKQIVYRWGCARGAVGFPWAFRSRLFSLGPLEKLKS